METGLGEGVSEFGCEGIITGGGEEMEMEREREKRREEE